MKTIIKEGDPQPFDCDKCKGKKGYRVIERYMGYSDYCYDENGKYTTVVHSEGTKVLAKLKTPCCDNCLGKLNFKIN